MQKTLYQLSKETGVSRPTLSYRADKVLGRHTGLFTDAEQVVLLELQRLRADQVEGKIQPNIEGKIQPNIEGKIQPNSEGKIQPNIEGKIQPNIEYELILMIDRVLEMKLPYWRSVADHLKILRKFLKAMQQKGIEAHNEDMRMYAKLEKEYNQWIDEQLMGDETAYNRRLERDLQMLEALDGSAQ